MVHVQRGDERQYLSKHVPQTDYTGEYINLVNQGLQAGVSITQKANESNIANYGIELSNNFLAKNNEINTKYQSDPDDPERERELREAFDLMASKYKINPLCQKQWNDVKTDVYNNYQTYNSRWAESQKQTNLQTNLKSGYEGLCNQISMMGYNNANVDEIRLVYANGIKGLRNAAIAGLGEVTVDNFLKDSTHDVMTTYLSALALNNPIAANELLQREDVRNDIGRAETLEKLESYVTSSLTNQNKRTAINELCTALRAMNSKEADDLINGKADLNKLMKFTENNKALPEGSKEFVLGIYGIGSKTDYYYDKDKKTITKKEEKKKEGEIPEEVKREEAYKLYEDLHGLITMDEYFEAYSDKKKIKENPKEASDFVVNYMKATANMQGRIDSACKAGIITKDERKRLMNSYIAPAVDYAESALNNLDEKSFMAGFAGRKTGYENIKNQFNMKDANGKALKGEALREVQKQKLFAQNYYMDELNKIVQKTPNLESIFSIEKLPSYQQREIYKTASENALKRAKRWTNAPEVFFAKEYPEIYAAPFIYFNEKEALQINRRVAENMYKRAFGENDGSLDLKDFAQNKMREEINASAKQNRIKAGETFHYIKERDGLISREEPKSLQEFYARVKALGLDVDEFMKDARERGFLAKRVSGIDEAFKNAHHEITHRDSMGGYYRALLELEGLAARKARGGK